MTPNKCKCGCDPYTTNITDYMCGYTLGYYVVCENCGRQSMMAVTEEDAIIVWNTKEENK